MYGLLIESLSVCPIENEFSMQLPIQTDKSQNNNACLHFLTGDVEKEMKFVNKVLLM